MPVVNRCLVANLLVLLMVAEPSVATGTGFFDRMGVAMGVNFPRGNGVMDSGVYPIGVSLRVDGSHPTSTPVDLELLSGIDIMVDIGGGGYVALPVLLNATREVADLGGGFLLLSGFFGLGYSYHHLFSVIRGVTLEKQHSLAFDVGLKVSVALGERWRVFLRGGAFRSFTRPVNAYFSGTRVTSGSRFAYGTLPVLIGISRRM
ncbi:MAG: hypothetical protein CME04_22205 [Gemmatimonadaceae bacterium]|jgi:hypothetical protein|nr:hypothetical protein [Gemmatimonadaceae bacterium]